MLETLISSKTRVKLLLKFFLNSEMKAYLRGLESEFKESSNAIRVELNRLEDAGMLESEVKGNKKFFYANKLHPLFDEVRNILLKHVGINNIIENVISDLGDVEIVYLTGTFAQGIDSPIIDLIIVGDVDSNYLHRLCEKVEGEIKRRIRTIVYTRNEFSELDFSKLPERTLIIYKKEH